jgi:hypothetical protein
MSRRFYRPQPSHRQLAMHSPQCKDRRGADSNLDRPVALGKCCRRHGGAVATKRSRRDDNGAEQEGLCPGTLDGRDPGLTPLGINASSRRSIHRLPIHRHPAAVSVGTCAYRGFGYGQGYRRPIGADAPAGEMIGQIDLLLAIEKNPCHARLNLLTLRFVNGAGPVGHTAGSTGRTGPHNWTAVSRACVLVVRDWAAADARRSRLQVRKACPAMRRLRPEANDPRLTLPLLR